ncbi:MULTISPECIES: TonB-dependent siderophore receptor [unclassified Acinetobacter]|uniref:TonB-dependent siderophore receptor n=1 Tax=unclassified Acinetobacter TaxID=196816 RepID=UPI00190AD726|nr:MULTISPECIES: TonB-dependent siderophore receptor [unclassified Acinetobacter]MBK0064476.1 TonB-dependent siderophore receptor [Acinetobacter sp. S55]MBK0067174.1 TonB-dependent siderophore receptor [Acinetobacter sp. S54]
MFNTQPKKLAQIISVMMFMAASSSFLHADDVLPIIKLKAEGQDQHGYTVKKTNAATKMDLALKDTPQSVSVITAEQIQDQQLKALSEVLDQTPGIYQQRYGAAGAVGTGGEYASYYARGSKVNNFLIDGVISTPVTTGRTGMSMSTLDPSIYENVTVVKGATGLTSGVGYPSASINLNRKLATSKVSTGSLNLSTSSFDDKWAGFRTIVDAQTPLNESGTVRGRTVISYDDYDSFMNWGDSHSGLFYTTLGADLDANTTLNVGALYQRAKSKGLSVHAFTNYSNGVLSTRDREDNSAARWAYGNVDTINAFIELEHRFDNGWKVQTNYNYLTQDTDAVYAVVGSNPGRTANYVDNTGRVTAGYQKLHPELHGLDISASGPYQLLGREQQMMVGVSYQNVQADDPYYDRAIGSDWVNLDTWNGYIPVPATLYNTTGKTNTTDMSQYGYYAATRLNPTDRLHLILGVRGLGYDYKETTASESTADFSKDKASPYAGLTFDLTSYLTAYVSYTNIFMPQAERNADYSVLEPVQGDSYEGGLKAAFYENQLNLSAAYFQSNLKDFANYVGSFADGPHIGESIYEGVKAKTEGFEIEANGQILPHWNIQTGYTYAKTTSVGQTINRDYPKQQFKLYTTYNLPVLDQRLKLGGGIRWQSEIVDATLSGTAYDANRQDSFAVIDLMAKYQVTRDFALGLNVNNVGDEEYHLNVSNGTYGDPRTYIVSLNYKF